MTAPATQKQLDLLTALARAGFIAKSKDSVELLTFFYVAKMSQRSRQEVSEAISRARRQGIQPVWAPIATSAPVPTQESLPMTAEAQVPEQTALDLSGLPAGRYAVPGGETRLKVLVDRPEEGDWAGWVFVKDAAEYGMGKRYGSQRPGSTYRGDIQEELAAIIADPQAAAAAYGHLVGRCGICNRKLEQKDSVERGIGPVCAGKVGWA